jgi:hypothetical protein
MIDPEKAKGQKQLVAACPLGHIWWNEELNVPQKWSLDAHLLDAGWKEPRPVTVCASEAFKAILIEDSEMAALAKAEKLEHYNAEAEKTRSRLYYKNLHKFNKEFIAGSVTKTVKGVVDTAEGIKVNLIKDGAVIATQETDFFGDFKFDKLLPNSGKYTVKVSANGKEAEREVDLKLSTTIADIDI